MHVRSTIPWIASDRDAARYASWYPHDAAGALECARCGSTEDVSPTGAEGVPLCVDCLALDPDSLWGGYYEAVYDGN